MSLEGGLEAWHPDSLLHVSAEAGCLTSVKKKEKPAKVLALRKRAMQSLTAMGWFLFLLLFSGILLLTQPFPGASTHFPPT